MPTEETLQRREQKRAYYQANKEKFAERSRKWRAENPERWREMARKSISKNPQGNADRASIRRARERGVHTEKVDRAAIYERDNGICHLCEAPVPRDRFTLDHVIPIAKGGPHTAENLKVAHKSCNSSKRDGGRKMLVLKATA